MKTNKIKVVGSVFLSLILFTTLPGSSLLAADKYVIDASHSSVEFSVAHMVIANVKGSFNEFSGTFLYDEKDFKKWQLEGSIKVASIDTNDDKRDAHLRSPDFFDAEKYPEISFKSSNFVKKGEGYVLVGDFTIRDVTKNIQIPLKVKGPITDPWGNTRLGLEGSLTINRQDYKVSFSKTMDNGGLVVGDEVTIFLNAEVVQAK